MAFDLLVTSEPGPRGSEKTADARLDFSAADHFSTPSPLQQNEAGRENGAIDCGESESDDAINPKMDRHVTSFLAMTTPRPPLYLSYTKTGSPAYCKTRSPRKRQPC